MNSADLDRQLAGEIAVVPSSGFAGAVMEAVRREAAMPVALVFPWGRASTGLGGSVFAVAVAALAGAAHPANLQSFVVEQLRAGIQAVAGNAAESLAWLTFAGTFLVALSLAAGLKRSSRTI